MFLSLAPMTVSAAYKTNRLNLSINGQKQPSAITVLPYKGQYLLGASPVLKKFNASFSLDSSAKHLKIKINKKNYTVYINKKAAFLQGKRIYISASPRIINGRTMLPVSFIEQLTGTKIIINNKSRVVTVNNSSQKISYPDSVKLKSDKKEKIVVIDPGHGGSIAGAKYGGLKEKDLNLDVSKRLFSLLKSKGVKVYLTRKTDKTMSLAQRYRFANSLKASLFISVHHNALPGNRLYSGTETLFKPYGASLNNIDGKKLAQITQNELVKRLGTISRGIISRPELAVLRHTKMPSIIAEIGYMTNKSELSRMKSSSFRQKAAEALCSAIIKTLNKM